MKTSIVSWMLLAATVGPLSAAPSPSKTPPRKNGTVAFLAGTALHLTQNAQALQRAALKKREQVYGPNDPQVKAGYRNLRVIRHKMRYFRHAKRHSEGRR